MPLDESPVGRDRELLTIRLSGVRIRTEDGPSQATAARRDDVQGLRGLAVILVVVFHSGLAVPGGFVGVDVFFVISGFVITRLLWLELRTTGRLALGRFYARRAKRLLPALALTLAFVALASLVLQNPLGEQQLTARTGVAAALFAANASLWAEGTGYFALDAATNPLLHTWTLAVEEQFYVLFPAVLIAGWTLGRRKSGTAASGALLAVGAVFAVSLAVSIFFAQSPNLPIRRLQVHEASFAFYGSPTRAWEFALGGLLAIREPQIMRMRRWVGLAAATIGFVLVSVAALAITAATPLPGAAALVPDLGAALLIAAGTIRIEGIAAVLATRPMTWIGDLSYGWYLWHWPAIVFTRVLWPDAPPVALLGMAILALLPTWLSYRWVENPIRSNRNIVGRRALAIAAACVSIPVVVNGALWEAARAPIGPAADLAFQARGHADLTRHCIADLPADKVTTAGCTWKTPGAKGTIILIGDSNAGQFAEPVAAAAAAEGFNMTLATFGGCPFADLITTYSTGHDNVACRDFVSLWQASLERSRPSLVILANASTEYLKQGNGITFTSPTSAVSSASAPGKATLWEEAIRSELARLGAAGVPSVLIHTIPHFTPPAVGAFDLRSCPGFWVYTDPRACGKSVSRTRIEAQSRSALIAEQLALQGLPLATGINFIDTICTPSECSTNIGKRWLYRDGAHLSVEGSMLVEPRMAELVRDHARTA